MPSLDKKSCFERQAALSRVLGERGVDAAIISDPRNLMYFFNYYARPIFPAAAMIFADGSSVFSKRDEDGNAVFAGRTEGFESSKLSTLKPDVADLAFGPLVPLVKAGAKIGFDGPVPFWLLPEVAFVDVRDALRVQQRSKWPDELAIIEQAIAASEAAYAAVEPLFVDGVPEIELFAAFQSAAVITVGEAIGELGNDYRGGAGGGTPRRVGLREGDLVPVDTGVVVRHYYSDLCRTYAVGGNWDTKQLAAARRVVEAQQLAESKIAPGVSCKDVYEEVHAFLDGYHGWQFPSHLGHGFGLRPIETPRINPHWEDVFQVGDTFTLEPGLYADELRAGVRLENDYVVTESGVRKLSDSTAYLSAFL